MRGTYKGPIITEDGIVATLLKRKRGGKKPKIVGITSFVTEEPQIIDEATANLFSEVFAGYTKVGFWCYKVNDKIIMRNLL